MIRINLLPQAKRGARGAAAGGGSASGWIVAYFAAALLACVAFALMYFSKRSELDEQLARNAALQRRIEEVTAQSANLDEVRARLERSRQLEQVVAELQRARFGPTRVLMELSRILSAGGGPSVNPQRLEEIRRDNPLAGYNRSWDFRRLWLTGLREEDRRVQIRGSGKTNEDVAEFLRRLSLSESFADVHLERTQAARLEVRNAGTTVGIDVIDFELTATVRY